jgi:hypothetical protein
MNCQAQWRRSLFRTAIAIAAMAALGFRSQLGRADADPWTAADVIDPAQLARELAQATGGARPTILYVGFRALFKGGHIAGALFHGTASTAQGLAELKTWAAALPRNTQVVIYCGCCPFDRCPNIRPGFVALHGMGFGHLRVLMLPKNFAADWADRGYPIEKGL